MPAVGYYLITPKPELSKFPVILIQLIHLFAHLLYVGPINAKDTNVSEHPGWHLRNTQVITM